MLVSTVTLSIQMANRIAISPTPPIRSNMENPLVLPKTQQKSKILKADLPRYLGAGGSPILPSNISRDPRKPPQHGPGDPLPPQSSAFGFSAWLPEASQRERKKSTSTQKFNTYIIYIL